MSEHATFSKIYGHQVPREIWVRGDLSYEPRQPLLDILRQVSGPSFLWKRIQPLMNPPERTGPVVLADDERKADFERKKGALLALEDVLLSGVEMQFAIPGGRP